MEPTFDIFANKGIEYLYVIGYLLLFIPFWLFLSGRRRAKEPARAQIRVRAPTWAAVPDGYYFHLAHTWALPSPGGEARVGLDALATALVGNANAVLLPAVGQHLEAGRTAATLEVDGTRFDLLAPVDGEVVAINPAVADRPETMVHDPYGAGWLYAVRLAEENNPARTLLHGAEARAWMGQAELSLLEDMAPGVGPTLQDGGELIPGSLRQIAPQRWRGLVGRILRSSGGSR